MKFASRATVNAEIPTASMADIAFLLIIFFMVTTVFANQRGVPFTLPERDPNANEETRESVLIEVHLDGRISLDGQNANLGDIEEYIKPKLAINPNKPVILKTDFSATYGDMMSVMDILKQMNVSNIAIPAREDYEEWG